MLAHVRRNLSAVNSNRASIKTRRAGSGFGANGGLGKKSRPVASWGPEAAGKCRKGVVGPPG